MCTFTCTCICMYMYMYILYVHVFDNVRKGIKRSPPIEGADCSPCTDDSPCTDNSPVHRSSMNSELSNQQDIVIHVHVRPKRKLEKERDERCKMTAILESAETAQKALENKVRNGQTFFVLLFFRVFVYLRFCMSYTAVTV